MAAKSPHFEKLFFPAILERPTEAPGIVLEKLVFQKGLAAYSGNRRLQLFGHHFESVPVIIVGLVLCPENRVAATRSVFIVKFF